MGEWANLHEASSATQRLSDKLLARSGKAVPGQNVDSFRATNTEALETARTMLAALGFHFSIRCSPEDSVLANSQTLIASHAEQGLYASSE
jgi:hypothetical protein